MTMDYFYAFLVGAKANRYVDGGLKCGEELRRTQYDLFYMTNFLGDSDLHPTETKLR